MKIVHKNMSNQLGKSFLKTSLCLLAATCTTVPLLTNLEAIASSHALSTAPKIAQLSQDWQTGVRLLRLLDNSGKLSSIGILLDVANKPSTTYANAVYQLYVRRDGEWREVYTTSGARLLTKNAGRYIAPVEVISLDLLSERISLNDIYNGDLRAVAIVRYDLPNGVKDSRFEIAETRNFASIVSISSSELSSGRIGSIYTNNSSINSSNNSSVNSSNDYELSDRDLGISNGSQTTDSQFNQSNQQSNQTVVIQTSNVQTSNSTNNSSIRPVKPISVSNRNDEDDDYEDNDGRRSRGDRNNNDNGRRRNRRAPDGVELSNENPHRGHFSLAVLQNQPRLSQVIARVSLKSKRSNGFLAERFVGDYRFNINQRATFVRGLNTGDRLIVRLFDLQNRPLGYSEVQLLKDFSTISLILPSDPSAYGTLRTVSGIDSRQIGRIDNNVRVYDYFTRIQPASLLSQTAVQFLSSSQSVPLNLFNFAGLPQIPSQPSFSNAFTRGNYSLINRTLNVFTREMPPVMQVLPGQLTSLIPISNSQTTIEVVRSILNYKDLRPSGIPTIF